jgi:prepilin-type N-terminal cleavage/methylation domain-containing protein
MKRKLNKGFTLGELLIVVAIIAVLVAISIPIFNNQIKKARFATNQANARAAYAAVMAEYIDQGMPVATVYTPYKCYTYNVSTGKLENMGAVNFGCKVRTGSTGPALTDISTWKVTSFANMDDRTLGSDVYKYGQIFIVNGKITEYDALLDPKNNHW